MKKRKSKNGSDTILEKLKQGYRNIADKLFHTKEEYMGIEIIVYVVVEK